MVLPPDWEQVRSYVEKMHEEMRKMYGIPDMSLEGKRMYVGPLPEWHEGHDGYGNKPVASNHRSQDYPPGEKTLVSKPHPEGCHCPKCGSKPGTAVLPQKRIGDTARNKTLDHLQEMYARGYLSTSELDARQQAALAATLQDELDFLMADLPSPVKAAVKPEPVKAGASGVRAAVMWAANVVMITFPVMSALTTIYGGAPAGAAALGMIGGLAGMLLTVLSGMWSKLP